MRALLPSGDRQEDFCRYPEKSLAEEYVPTHRRARENTAQDIPSPHGRGGIHPKVLDPRPQRTSLPALLAQVQSKASRFSGALSCDGDSAP